MIKHFSDIAKSVYQELSDFSWRNTQAKHALQGALAGMLAIFIAMTLSVPYPFWAGISAIMVTQTSIGSTFLKSFRRIMGTAIGAIGGILFSLLFVNDVLIYCLIIYIVVVVGTYCSFLFEKSTYAWLLGYVTFAMVLLVGLADPLATNVINFGFDRIFEITIGICSGLIMTILFHFQFESKHLECTLGSMAKIIRGMSNDYFDLLLNNDKNPNNADLEYIKKTYQKYITSLEKSIGIIGFEPKLSKHDSTNLYTRATITSRHLIEILYMAHDSLVQSPIIINDEQWKKKVLQLKESTENLIISYYNFVLEDHNEEAVWNALEQLQIDSKDFCDQKSKQHNLMTELSTNFYLFAQQIQDAISSKDVNIDNNWKQVGKKHYVTHAWRYDTYFLKNALILGSAMVFLPLVWLILSFPGYVQVMVSIVTCVALDQMGTKNKASLRFFGCLVGSLAAYGILGLSIENLFVQLILAGFFVFVFLYIQFGSAKSSYLGTQATIPLMIGLFYQLSPTVSMEGPGLRLTGIMLGVLTIIAFQYLFLPFHEYDKLRHSIKQLRKSSVSALELLFSPTAYNKQKDLEALWLFRQRILNLPIIDLSQKSKLYELAEDLRESYRGIYHDLYWLILIKSIYYRKNGLSEKESQWYYHIAGILLNIVKEPFNSIETILCYQNKLNALTQQIKDWSKNEINLSPHQTTIENMLIKHLLTLVAKQKRCLSSHMPIINYVNRYDNLKTLNR